MMLEWVATGIVIGGGIGFIAGRLSWASTIDKMVAENAVLQTKLFAVTHRDERGRFVKRK